MANTGISRIVIEDALKEIYHPLANEVYNNNVTLTQHVLTKSQGLKESEINGKSVNITISTRRASSFSAPSENGNIARSTQKNYFKVATELKQFTASSAISDLADVIAKDAKKAVSSDKIRDAWAEAAEGAAAGKEALSWSDETAALAEITLVTGSNPFVLEIDDQAFFDAERVAIGQYVQIDEDVASVSESEFYIVTDIDFTGKTVTVSRSVGSGTPVNGDLLFPEDSAGNGLNGIKGAIDNSASASTEFQGIAPNNSKTEGKWQANLIDAQGAELGYRLLDDALHDTALHANIKLTKDIRQGKTDQYLLIANRRALAKSYEEQEDQIRYGAGNLNMGGDNYNTVTLPSGYTLKEVVGVPDGCVYGIHVPSVYNMQAPGGLQNPDGKLFYRFEKKTYREVFLEDFSNYIWEARNTHLKISNLDVDPA